MTCQVRSNATILWGTGRGDYQRDGNLSNAILPTLRDSTKTSSLLNANPGDLITYTITLRNPGQTMNNASMTDPLPPELVYAGNLWASSGIASYADGMVSWNGAVSSPRMWSFALMPAWMQELSPQR